MPGPSAHPRRRQRSRHGQARSSREDTPEVDGDDSQPSQLSTQNAATASELVQQAQEATTELKSLLKSQAPWSKDAFNVRQKARNAYLCILFQHPLHPQAQSIELLWISTTYTLISAYRDAVARIEATLPAQGSGTRVNKEALSHLRTTLSRFRQALVKEAAFYHSLITRIVSFHRLQDRTARYLAQVNIPVASGEDSEDDPSLAPHLSKEELDKKIDIVYKGLICLGDLERYKEQYSDKARKERDGAASANKNGRSPADRFAKAVMYYEVARGLQPDNGTAFNQLAVIDGYLGDNFHCTYHYFRALEVRQPFPSGEANLERVLKKVFDKWRSQRHASAGGENGEQPSPPESQEETDVFKRELLTVVSILYIRAGTSHFNALCSGVAVRFASLLRERKLLSETIVKTTAMAIGSHYRARLGANSTSSGGNDRRNAIEGLSLVFLMSIFTSLLVVAAEEAEDALSQLGDESAVADDDDTQPLAPRISAVLRRLLPSLRIISRWLKAHLDYTRRIAMVSRDASNAIGWFWQPYHRLVTALRRAFPLAQLPELDRPLEEDRDMRGFLPLYVKRVSEQLLAMETDGEVHPNEEQLMRIASLLVDDKLMFSPPDAQRDEVPAALAEIAEGLETQSQAETEDDPVNLAMRASLGGDGISVGAASAEDEEDEVILWGRSTPVISPAVAPPTTAQGLLQSLTLQPSPSNTRPPSLLFGGMDGGGQTIWTMSREESQKGMQRASASARASEQWDGAVGAVGAVGAIGAIGGGGPSSAGPIGPSAPLGSALGSVGPPPGLGGQWEGPSRQASGQWDGPSRQASGQWSRAPSSRQASGQWDSHSAPTSARPSVSAQWDARPWENVRPPPGLTPPGLSPAGLTPPPGLSPVGVAPPAPFGQNWPHPSYPGTQRPGSEGGAFDTSHGGLTGGSAPQYTGQAGHSGTLGGGAAGPRPPPGLALPGLRNWSPSPSLGPGSAGLGGQGGQGGPGGQGVGGLGGAGGPGAQGGQGGGDIWGPPRPQNHQRNSADNWTQAQFQQFGARWYPPQEGAGSGASGSRGRWREG